jgi:hypothetical protein
MLIESNIDTKVLAWSPIELERVPSLEGGKQMFSSGPVFILD